MFALLQQGTGITLAYNDAANTLTISATGGGGSPITLPINQSDVTGLVDALAAKATAAQGAKADSAVQPGDLAAYAPKASPAFTGTPTAPNQAAGNNSTRLATTAYVDGAIATLVASAPGTLDTLDELAAALGDDPNFAATLATNLAGKASRAANLSDLADAPTARANLGLGNVDNTSDLNKQISTATQAALNGKAATSHTHLLAQITDFASGLATALASWIGSTAITTLGTIATGVWQGSKIAVGYLGSGTPAAGKYLDGGGSWTDLPAGGGGTPGGASGQVQTNNGGAFAGSPNLTFGSNRLVVGQTTGAVTVGPESGNSYPGVWLATASPNASSAVGTWWNSLYSRFYVGTGANSVPWILTAPSGIIIWAQLDCVGMGGGATVSGAPAAACHAQSRLTTTPAMIAQGASGQTANLHEWRDSAAVVHSTVTENGYATTRKNAAPADAELIAGEAAYWFDATNGAARFVIKAKTLNGTIASGSITLS